jgi:MoaA/NifB/PqqE/SkfB family radical SAM enzyme
MTSGKLIVTLSLEGMAKTHDEIRHPTSFERTVQTFKKLKGVDGIRLKFNTVLCEKNCDEIVELVNFVKRLGPDYHSILLLRGKARDPAMRLPSVDRIEAVGKRIERIQQGYGYGRTGLLSRIQRNYQAYKRDLTLRTLREKRQVIPCLAGVSHLVVWSEGSVSPCELLPAVGKLREKDLGELLNGPDMKRAVSCIAKGECFCTHDCNMIENILFNPRSYLKLLVGGVQRG